MSDSFQPHGQASLSITNSQSLLKLMSIELVWEIRMHVKNVEYIMQNARLDEA